MACIGRLQWRCFNVFGTSERILLLFIEILGTQDMMYNSYIDIILRLYREDVINWLKLLRIARVVQPRADRGECGPSHGEDKLILEIGKKTIAEKEGKIIRNYIDMVTRQVYIEFRDWNQLGYAEATQTKLTVYSRWTTATWCLRHHFASLPTVRIGFNDKVLFGLGFFLLSFPSTSGWMKICLLNLGTWVISSMCFLGGNDACSSSG